MVRSSSGPPERENSVEARFGEGARHLPGPVGAEVDEDRYIALGGAVVVADHGRLDELVGLATLIGGGDRLLGARCREPLGVDDRVVGELGPLPAGVAIHRVIATADRGDTAGMAQPALQFGEVGPPAVWERVAAVGEGVEDEVWHPLM